jgi:CRISPR-associated protein Csb2
VNSKRRGEAVLVATPARSHRPAPTFARFALDGPVLPLVTETLPLAESVRRKLLECCKRLQCPDDPRRAYADLPSIAPAFWGKDEGRRPLTGHRHAFFLPVDEDNDGRIDHVAVFAPMGFTEREPQALGRLRRLQFGDLDLSLALVGLVGPGDFAGSRLLGPSTTWESASPFLATRHLKRRGRKRDPLEWSQGPDGRAAFVRQVLGEELERRAALGVDRLAAAEIEPLVDHAIGPRRLRSYDFHLGRAKRGDDGARRPRGAFRLRFPQPISGPIALGHSCHFGLGLFLRVGEDARRNRDDVSN